MVGHTNEDVDQLFSRISSRMAKDDAHTLPQLKTAVESSTTPSPGDPPEGNFGLQESFNAN